MIALSLISYAVVFILHYGEYRNAKDAAVVAFWATFALTIIFAPPVTMSGRPW